MCIPIYTHVLSILLFIHDQPYIESTRNSKNHASDFKSLEYFLFNTICLSDSFGRTSRLHKYYEWLGFLLQTLSIPRRTTQYCVLEDSYMLSTSLCM